MKLYGITGKKGHGKDTFARLVVEADGTFVVTHFAKALKQMIPRIFGVTANQLNDPDLKEVPLTSPIEIDSFLPAMRSETGLNIQPAGRIARSPREIMQLFATEYVRKAQWDYWVQRLIADISTYERVLIADVRFPNEEKAIRDAGGKIIKIVKIDAPLVIDGHASETEIDKIEPDLLVGVKNGDLHTLQQIADLVAQDKIW